jgi:hypothetical protein
MITQEEYLARLKRTRYDWIDEIPEEILHSSHSEGEDAPRYKVRKAWLSCLSIEMIIGKDVGYLSPETINEFKIFESYLKQTNIHRRKTARKDIEKGNALLDSAIKDLEGKLK